MSSALNISRCPAYYVIRVSVETKLSYTVNKTGEALLVTSVGMSSAFSLGSPSALNGDLQRIAEYCRSSQGVPVKSAIERMRGHHDIESRRVDYFRGEKLMSYLVSKKKFDVDSAQNICVSMLREGLIHQANRLGRGQLELSEMQKWDPVSCYVWDFEGSKRFSHFLTGLLIVGMLGVTCFPIWPHFLKVYLWYCSVTMLIFMILFVAFRGIIFLNFWIWGYEFWIFPNLFDESLTVIDSFKPLYTFEPGAAGQRYYRSALVVASVAFFVYCYNQPTDFDTFLSAQKEFVSDLYEGKLLADTSQRYKDEIDKIQRPSFEELAMEEEHEASERAARSRLEEMHNAEALDDEIAENLIDSMLDDISVTS